MASHITRALGEVRKIRSFEQANPKRAIGSFGVGMTGKGAHDGRVYRRAPKAPIDGKRDGNSPSLAWVRP